MVYLESTPPLCQKVESPDWFQKEGKNSKVQVNPLLGRPLVRAASSPPAETGPSVPPIEPETGMKMVILAPKDLAGEENAYEAGSQRDTFS